MKTRVDRHAQTRWKFGAESLIQSHLTSNISLINNKISLSDPKYGFIADGLVKDISFIDIDGQRLVEMTVFRETGEDKFAEEKWIVYF